MRLQRDQSQQGIEEEGKDNQWKEEKKSNMQGKRRPMLKIERRKKPNHVPPSFFLSLSSITTKKTTTVPALSVVVGLILAFRTNTAYDRFWEGRKLWSSLDVQMRNFSRMIWVGMKETNHQVHAAGSNVSLTAAAPVPGAPAAAPAAAPSNGLHLFGRNSGKASPNGKNTAPNALTEFHHADDYEKVLVIKLLLAYAVSIKHHLRQEFGVRYFDLEYLLPEGFAPCAATDHVEIKIVHDKALGDRQRHYNEDPWTIRSGNDEGQMSLPLEIAYALSLWVLGEARGGRIESSLIGNLLGSINTMTDIFTNMERIVFTPIPLAYSIHL